MNRHTDLGVPETPRTTAWARAIATALLAAALIVAITSCGSSSGEHTTKTVTVATFEVAGVESYKIELDTPELIAHARALMAGSEDAPIPNGVVVRDAPSINAPWSWHIDPTTLEFADVTAEVCDGLPSYVQDGTVTSDRYCPWLTKVTAIEDVDSSTVATPGVAQVVDSKDGVGLHLDQTTLDAAEQQRSSEFASTYVEQLIAQHPELRGMTVAGISPVFDEHTPEPIGAMARLTLPAVVPTVELDLVRLHEQSAEVVPSQVTNLRALDMIYLFSTNAVVHLGIDPQPGDAADPATATAVTPLDPEQHRSPDFAGTE